MLAMEVKDQYAILEKVKAEIEELKVRKSGLVRELNLELLDAKEEADKVIADARANAKELTDLSNEALALQQEVSSKMKREAEDILANAKIVVQQLNKDKDKLAGDRVDFDAEKVAYENDLKARKNEASSLTAQANDRLKALNDREIGLSAREASVARREQAIAEAVEVQNNESNRLILINNELLAKESELIKASQEVKILKDEGDSALSKATIIQSKIVEDTIANDKCLKEERILREKNDEDKQAINAHFKRIEKDSRDLEERKVALDEREELITLKDREVTEKIRVLEELRKKGK